VPSFSFPKTNRLLNKKDFDSLRGASIKFPSKSLIIYSSKWSNDNSLTRIGISVSKKTGNAVFRNRLKRIIRDCFRNSDYKNIGKDVLIVLKRGPYENQSKLEQQVRLDLEQSFKRIGKNNAR
jgi:ribonuclease P protein component